MASDAKLCQGKDVFERMNFLYQASQFVASKSTIAASYYGSVMVNCAKKAVLRMDHNLKRTICKSCQSPLIPGETARVRLQTKPAKAVKWTCLICKSVRKFPTKRAHKLWTEQPEALVQLFDYTPKSKTIEPNHDCKSNLKEKIVEEHLVLQDLPIDDSRTTETKKVL